MDENNKEKASIEDILKKEFGPGEPLFFLSKNKRIKKRENTIDEGERNPKEKIIILEF